MATDSAENTSDQDKLFLITRYNPALPPIREIIHDNWKTLEASRSAAALVDKEVVLGFKRAQNLKDILIKSRISYHENPPQHPGVSGAKHQNFCHRHNCRYCKHFNTSGRVTSTQTGRTYVVPDRVCCESSNLVYLLTCNICKMQYVGQTLRQIRERLREHFRYIENKMDSQPLGRHFALPDHSGLNLQVQVLEYIQTPPLLERTKQLRLEREKHWIHQLRSIEPFGLNFMGR